MGWTFSKFRKHLDRKCLLDLNVYRIVSNSPIFKSYPYPNSALFRPRRKPLICVRNFSNSTFLQLLIWNGKDVPPIYSSLSSPPYIINSVCFYDIRRIQSNFRKPWILLIEEMLRMIYLTGILSKRDHMKEHSYTVSSQISDIAMNQCLHTTNNKISAKNSLILTVLCMGINKHCLVRITGFIGVVFFISNHILSVWKQELWSRTQKSMHWNLWHVLTALGKHSWGNASIFKQGAVCSKLTWQTLVKESACFVFFGYYRNY